VRRARALLASLALCATGCGSLDLCNFAEFQGDTCVTVHLGGDLNAGIKDFDELQVDVTYDLGVEHFTRRFRPTKLGDGGTLSTLPAAFGVVYPSSARVNDTYGRIFVLATRSGEPVGLGGRGLNQFNFAIKLGEHGAVDIALKPAEKSLCFNGLEDPDEDFVDCGGTSGDGICPSCPAGSKCSQNKDCASNICDDTNFPSRCR